MNEFTTKNCNNQIDCIIESSKYIVLCSYNHKNDTRSGKLQFMRTSDLEIEFEQETTGTLCAFALGTRIYTANSKDIAIYENKKIIAQIETKAINTYIFGGDRVYTTNILGEINVFDYNLNFIESIQITKEPIWIVKQSNGFLYFGDEAGYCYRYNLADRKYAVIGEKRQGIIDIFIDQDLLYISSYDDYLNIYDLKTLKLIKSKKIGSLWKIERFNDGFACACMYDGLQIFDSHFNLIKRFKTDSICYGLCLTSNRILWSSFYDNSISYYSIQD